MTTARDIKLGIAPIAWTNDDLPELGQDNTFEQCISEMALAGFQGTEIGNKYPKDPTQLKSYLALRQLEVASAWFSTFFTSQPFEQTVVAFKQHRDFLAAMGANVIVVSEQGTSIQSKPLGLRKHKPYLTDLQWQSVIQGLEKLGELAAAKKMTIVYHHHMGTGIQTKAEINRLMAETDPSKVSLLFDTGHLVLAGEDPLTIFQAHQKRIKHIHFKDIRQGIAEKTLQEDSSFLEAVKKGVFTVPGDGMIDFTPLCQEIDRSNYTGWVVVEAEQDPALANPFEYALKARSYLQKIWHR